jgi:hypothetical protein
MANYVLVHAAWHSGDSLHGVASLIRAKGHDVHTPTTKGNRPGDSKTIGLSEAIDGGAKSLQHAQSTTDKDFRSRLVRSCNE